MGLQGDHTIGLPTGGTHGTLAANATASVLIAGVPDSIEVTNRSTTEIFFTIDGTNPQVAAAGTFCLPAAIGATKVITVSADWPATPSSIRVKLISTGTPSYSVTPKY